MPTGKGHPRVVLQFNDFDFRHRKVLEILRSRPRNMTDIVVNAVMHYMSCPDAGDEFGNVSFGPFLYPSLVKKRKKQKRGSIMNHDGTSGGVLFRVFLIE